ncbi:NAD-dependent epimerase/dehydratase family protein [Acinetobacter sp. WZC-1]|uniref:NAD-dependent epimerase/dehydratase family protein n=1 Tax=Acinetobacter sp. WZC-1 TaxID=3459034 RepID=UPI00403DF4CE
MHILFMGYGQTSRRVAEALFQSGHQITTISRSRKSDDFAQHLIQDVRQPDLSRFKPIDMVYILLAPSHSTVEAYQQTYVDSVAPMVNALRPHPIQRIILVSSTRVYGQQQGEYIDDDTALVPHDWQGQLLLQMEQRWQQAYPAQTVIVRPAGIYGISVARMLKLAETTRSYPGIHWSNRIHMDDLAGLLVHLSQLQQPEKSYIATNNQPVPLHEIILWFQTQQHLPRLLLQSEAVSGKRILAARMSESGFQLSHPDCFEDYQGMLDALKKF